MKKRNITLNELDGIIGVIKKNNKQEKIVIISIRPDTNI